MGLTHRIIGSAIEVHRTLGPGLLESAYEDCLCRELSLRGIRFERQLQLPIVYKGVKVGDAFRVDLLVEDEIAVELKAVSALEPIHSAQLLTYLRLGGWHLGLLINFNEEMLKNGVRRLIL